MPIYLFFLLIITGCGSIAPIIDSELMPVVNMFIDVAEVPLTKLYGMESIKMKDLPQGIAGMCYLQDDDSPVKIEISNTIPKEWIEMTLVHELGHCLLGLEHSEDADSIMYPYLGDFAYYEVHKFKLIRAMTGRYL